MPALRCTFKGVCSGQDINNVLGIVDNGGGSGTTQDTVNLYSTAWAAHIVPLLSTNYGYTGLTAYDVNDTTQGWDSTSGGGTTGGQDGAQLPLFVSVSIDLRTGLRGRAGRGRTGLSPIPEAYTASSSGSGQGIDPTTLTTIRNAFAAFQSDIASTGGTGSPGLLAVISTVLKGEPRPTPLVTLVESFSVNTFVGTRLSRKLYA